MATIVYSSTDLAGVGIANALKQDYGFALPFEAREKQRSFNAWSDSEGKHRLVEITSPHVEADWLADFPETFGADLLVFASKHASASAHPCLSVHPTGNYDKAELGGKEGELALTSACVLFAAIDCLRANPLEGFEVTREATHHGPTSLPWPSLFAEVGSSAGDWTNIAACKTVAKAIFTSINSFLAVKRQAVIGVGGPHYCPKFNAFEVENQQFAFSHICPKYAIDYLSKPLFEQMLRRTVEPVKAVVIDWKGCSAEQRAKVLDFAEQEQKEAIRA